MFLNNLNIFFSIKFYLFSCFQLKETLLKDAHRKGELAVLLSTTRYTLHTVTRTLRASILQAAFGKSRGDVVKAPLPAAPSSPPNIGHVM